MTKLGSIAGSPRTSGAGRQVRGPIPRSGVAVRGGDVSPFGRLVTIARENDRLLAELESLRERNAALRNVGRAYTPLEAAYLARLGVRRDVILAILRSHRDELDAIFLAANQPRAARVGVAASRA